jgi:hypothetical protein
MLPIYVYIGVTKLGRKRSKNRADLKEPLLNAATGQKFEVLLFFYYLDIQYPKHFSIVHSFPVLGHSFAIQKPCELRLFKGRRVVRKNVDN